MAVMAVVTPVPLPTLVLNPVSSSSSPSMRLPVQPSLRLRLPGDISKRHGGRMSEIRRQQKCSIYTGARAEVKYVDGEEAKKLVVEEGYTIVDIRDKTQYDKAHIKSSDHIPLFIENTDNDFGTIINRTLHNNFVGLFFGLAYTKTNPEFISTFKKKFAKDSKLLLVCQEGLRSGTAADKLDSAGFQNLAYISSGLQKVKPGIFEKEGPKELQDAGKGGLVTIQGKVSAVVGTVLIAAYLFLTFFPNQAEQLFFSK